MENPGIFRLVTRGSGPYHESSGDEPFNQKALGLELACNFAGNTSDLEFTELSEVTHQSNDSVLIPTKERVEGPVAVFSGYNHCNELVDELIHSGTRDMHLFPGSF